MAFAYTRKYFLFCIVLLMTLVITSLRLSQQGKEQFLQLDDALQKKQEKTDVVILLSMIRSGSSIVGSIFNERKNVFYLYEPLFPFGKQECNEKTRESTLQVLQNITTCHFENLYQLYKSSKRNDAGSRCKKFHVCFAQIPDKTSRFMSRDSDICKTNQKNGAQVCPQPLDPVRLNKHCKQNLVAMKVNYLCELEWILPLLEEQNLNVKVVHLVRDPRSTVHSRFHSGHKNIENNANIVCNHMMTNLIFSETKLPKSSSLRNKYMRIRFEDFVLNPLGKTLQIYNFVGIEMDMHIKQWLEKAMSASNAENLSKAAPFGLKRNVMSVLNQWRTGFSFENVKTIQSSCQITLNKLGYRIYENATDVRNMNELHFTPIW